jgi:myo-inositol 2-dehydrogenase / D-chiro-inositol 1-dehydrogenase
MDLKPKSKSRREFITDAAALGIVGAIGAGNLFSSCSTSKDRYEATVFADIAPDGPPLKAGLIGCGGRGTGAAHNFLNAGPNLQITALGDVFQERIDRCRNSLKEQRNIDIPEKNCFTGFDAYKRVIDSDVDVVILATPPHFRPEQFEAAVQARKHAFIEKPCAVDPVGARSIMASAKMAESAGLSVVSGTQLRHARNFNATRDRVRNGAIGDLISANITRMSGLGWHYTRPSGISDMEAMLQNWQNWCWLSGDMLVEMFVHHIDVLNWYFEKFPTEAVGFGGRHQRASGDQFDFFAVEFAFDDGRKYYGMHRQISGCYNRSGNHLLYGTKGYTNCTDKIWDNDHNLVWEYEYPLDEAGQPSRRLPVVQEDQSHINLVTAIRTNTPVNEAINMASSSLVSIMGRESAYTGQRVTWDDMMSSGLRLGPAQYSMGPVDIREAPPIPGNPRT